MSESTQPTPPSLATSLARLDVRIWADKSLRECVSIAGRTSKRGPGGSVNPASVEAVLAMLVRVLEEERTRLAEKGSVPG